LTLTFSIERLQTSSTFFSIFERFFYIYGKHNPCACQLSDDTQTLSCNG